jgi:hypothetical protein
MPSEKKKLPGLDGILIGVGKPKKKDDAMGGEEDEGGLSDGAQALSDFRDAMDAGDFDGAYEAFERAVALCKDPAAAYEEPEEGAG